MNPPEEKTGAGIDDVSYGQTGYDTFEDEAEARHEARERFRRRLLCVIRGRLRERKGLRWWLVSVMVGCASLAWFLAEIPGTARFGSVWHYGFAVLATWPLYVGLLFLRAKAEGKTLDLAGHWDALKSRDEDGDFHDRNISEQIDQVVNKGWESTRYQGSNQGGGALLEFLRPFPNLRRHAELNEPLTKAAEHTRETEREEANPRTPHTSKDHPP